MAAFENVTRDEFTAIFAAAPASAACRKQHARGSPSEYDGRDGPDYVIHRGSLAVGGDFIAPGFNTLIIGDLFVEGLVDLHNPYDKGFDEGGQFIIVGSLNCLVFANEYGKCTLVDGDLTASDMLINGYEDSSLKVIGDLTTKFFYGVDIWAEVGGVANMEYGIGYCLPLGYCSGSEAIWPRHDENVTRQLLNLDATSLRLNPQDLLRLWQTGKPLFK
jgi:hypothetical protein